MRFLRRKHAPEGSKDTKFAGLALEGHFEFGFYSYFLNASNHHTDVPIDMVTFHFYASTPQRDNITSYEEFFSLADVFFVEAAEIVSIRDRLNPKVMLNVDETGVILPDDNNPKWTETDPGFPLLYWNAAAANYVYVWGILASIGVDFVGESQLTGYPSMPSLGLEPQVCLCHCLFLLCSVPLKFPALARIAAEVAHSAQYPSVSLLNWTDGSGNARFWALKLLLEEFPVGENMVATSISTSESGAENVCSEANYPDAAVLRCLDAGAVISDITFSSYGTPEGSCGKYVVNATCHAPNSSSIVQNLCFGKQSCTIPAITPIFGDPCVGTYKKLVVQARCSRGNGTSTASPVYAQGFVSSLSNSHKVLLVNKVARDMTVTFPSERIAGIARKHSLVVVFFRCVTSHRFAGSSIRYVDITTAFGPAQHDVLSSELIHLRAFSVSVLSLYNKAL